METPTFDLAIQKIYVRDVSFESPGAPEVFLRDFQPELKVDIRVGSRSFNEENHEVTLRITITATEKDGKEPFIIEVEQAGLFVVKGLDGEPLKEVLLVYCPEVLFPYAREAIDNLATRGGFPALQLAPLDFSEMHRNG